MSIAININSIYISAGRPWTQAYLNRNQAFYLSQEMYKVDEQKKHIENANNQIVNHEQRASRLLEIEEARYYRERVVHSKQIELLSLKIAYYAERASDEDRAAAHEEAVNVLREEDRRIAANRNQRAQRH